MRNLFNQGFAKVFLLLQAAFFLSACTSKPWVMLDGGWSDDTDPSSYDVLIEGVDNRRYPGNGTTKKIDPGFHNIYLMTTKPDRKGRLTDRFMPIDAKPCTTYYLAAHHKSNLEYDNKEWEPVIVREETIPTCLNTTKKTNDQY